MDNDGLYKENSHINDGPLRGFVIIFLKKKYIRQVNENLKGMMVYIASHPQPPTTQNPSLIQSFYID